MYEGLPGFLLRLNGRGPAGERLRSPDSPVWVRLSGGGGTHDSDRSTVGAAYDFKRLTAEAGVDVALLRSRGLTGSISVRHVTGSADVSLPAGNGDIDAKGIGAGLGVSWNGESGYYVDGRFSVTAYRVDFSSDKRGGLKGDASAAGHSVGIETGRRIALGERMSLTPRARLVRSGVSMDRFTDAVNSRVKLTEAKQLKGVVGLAAETGRVWDGGSFSLRGSADVERTLRGGATVVEVSGEKLRSESEVTRVLLGLGGIWRRGRFSLSGEATAGGPGSDDQEYAGLLNLGIRF